MSENIEKISLMKDDYLLREGDESYCIYYVVSGALSVHKRQGDQMVKVGTCFAGEIIGEMSFMAGEKRYASVKADSDSELLMLATHHLEIAKNKLPVWVNTLVATMIDRLNRTNNRIRI